GQRLRQCERLQQRQQLGHDEEVIPRRRDGTPRRPPSVVPALWPVSPARSCPGVRWSLLATAAGTARRRSGDGLPQGCFHARQRFVDLAHRYCADAEAEPAILAAQPEGLERHYREPGLVEQVSMHLIVRSKAALSDQV